MDAVPRGIAPARSNEIPIVFSPAGAGPREGELIIKTDSTITPERRIRLLGMGIDPRIRIFPEVVDFGRVVVGAVRTATVTIENVGTERVVVRAVTADVETSPEFSAVLRGIRGIEPGERFNLGIAYQPVGSGFDEGRFIVADDTALPMRVSVVVRGEGAIAELGIEPTRIAFEGVFTGETRSRFFELKNLGAVTHTVSSITLVTSSTASELSIVSSTAGEAPFSIEPGEVVRVEVAYSPRDDVDDTAEIIIASPALLDPVRIFVTGRATRPPFALLTPIPELLSFGPAELGTATVRRLRLINFGNSDSLLRGSMRISPPNAPYTLLDAPPADARFAPRDDHTVLVSFAPSELGVVPPAAVVIETLDQNMPRIEIPLEGEGVAGPVRDLEVDTLDLDVGHVPRGLGVERVLSLRSVGSATVTVSAIRLLDDANRTFELDATQLGPQAIAPGAVLRLSILFFDGFGLSGPRSGRLQLESDDADHPQVEVALSAETIEPLSDFSDLIVELAPTTPSNVELHLLRSGGVFFDRPSDVCFCSPNPDWGRLGEFDDDPLYLGRRIELEVAEAGLYSIAVHHRDGGEAPVNVELTVSSRGEQIGTLTRQIGPGQRWDSGTVSFDNRGPLFEPGALPLTRSLRDDCF